MTVIALIFEASMSNNLEYTHDLIAMSTDPDINEIIGDLYSILLCCQELDEKIERVCIMPI
jgi:hypothetical protein